jgi:hypothetical protein
MAVRDLYPGNNSIFGFVAASACMCVNIQQVNKMALVVFEWGVVKTRNAGISRNMAEYGGISRNMAEYHGIWRNITEYHDIFPEYHNIFRW